MRRFLLASILVFVIATPVATSSGQSSPPFAVQGAFASYTAEGGFIPYFSGVAGNITYTVRGVFPNGSMSLRIFENITAGEDLPPFITTLNVTDKASNPRVFPAVAVSNLSSHKVLFQDVSSTFLQNVTVSVPAGVFGAMEFTGVGPNDTSYSFWFEGKTGLLVEENAGTSALQLDSSNIATPLSAATGYEEVPYEIVFVLAFVIGGGLFLWLRHHYLKNAPKNAGPGAETGTSPLSSSLRHRPRLPHR